MTVENNILAAVLDNFRILRIDLDNPLEVDGNFILIKNYKHIKTYEYSQWLIYLENQVQAK